MQFENSSRALLPELDLFLLPATQTSVTKVNWVEYRPIGQNVDNTPIDIIIPGSSDYLNLKRSFLHIKLKVTHEDGTPVDNTATIPEHVGIINLFHHSMCNQIEVYLNNHLVSTSTNNYPYKAYIENLLQYGREAKETQLRNSGYYKDMAGMMDASEVLTGGNSGLSERYALVGANQTCHVYGPLNADMCQLNKYILNGVETRITLWPSKSKFNLVKPNTIVGDFKIKITDIYMHACKVTVAPDIVVAHNNMLMKSPAKYPYDRTRILTYALPTGSFLFREDNLFQFEKPDRIIIGFVSSAAFQGSYTRNPFNFLNLSINNIALYVNDISTPAQPMKLSFDDLDYKQAFYNLYTSLGKDGKDLGIDISPEEYPNGYTLFAFEVVSIMVCCPSLKKLI